MSIYSQIQLSETTRNKRKQIKNLMDNFMDFQWRGCSAFEKFGAFILNSKKGDLKFYNGPGFSNEYTKPQFSTNGGDLIGVSFNKQTISFSIGVYWISIEDYRKMISWLDPLVTDYIIFDYEPDFRYNVKLSKVGDSSRFIVGKESVLKNGVYVSEPRYYTELSLTFDIQGAPCAKGVHSYELKPKPGTNLSWLLKTDTSEFRKSDLDTPFEFELTIPLVDSNFGANLKEQLTLKLTDGVTTKTLYYLELSNLKYSSSIDTEENINIKYNSETGLLFLQYGGNYERVLTQLTTTDTGERIVSSFSVNKFYIPGQFTYPGFDYSSLTFVLEWVKIKNGAPVDHTLSVSGCELIAFPRTNVI